MKMLAPLAVLLLAACGSGDAADEAKAQPTAATVATAQTVDGAVKAVFQPYQTPSDAAC